MITRTTADYQSIYLSRIQGKIPFTIELISIRFSSSLFFSVIRHCVSMLFLSLSLSLSLGREKRKRTEFPSVYTYFLFGIERLHAMTGGR